ncbi:MAG: SDR family oxidoreductase [Candidatus Sericytochromatia bacterium]
MANLDGKICIVTGANSGVGKVTALELAKMGAEVIMVCRNQKKGEEALDEILIKSKNNKVKLMLCDFSSQKSIRAFVDEFKSKYDKLHILVNNAGLIIPERKLTEDGIELTFAINHIGYFLTTNLLLDLLKNSAPSRIVNVASDAHKAGHINFNDINYENNKYKSMNVYCDSKLANILFTKELAKRLKGTNVTANCLHPGVVNTNFANDYAEKFGFIAKIVKSFLITPEKGAETQIYLASSSEVEGITGEYFDKKKIKTPSKEARDPEIAEKLWKISERMTNLMVENG